MVHKKVRKEMKKILCNYYSQGNFGDDLFVFNLANHFCEDKIYLLTNPKRISPDFPKNVKCLTMASWFLSILGYVEGKLNNKILKKYLYCYIKTFPQKYGKRFDANVRIGGSLFMDKSGGGQEIPFTINKKLVRNFEFQSMVQERNGLFLIGINLGPVYHEEYWKEIEKMAENCNHVCIRDFSSYYPLRHLKNVQYAPDVGFCTNIAIDGDKKNKILISLIQIERKTKDCREIEAYYSLLAQVVKFFSEKEKEIVLLSMCDSEGDQKAVEKLKEKIKGEKYTVFSYCGNIIETIRLFSNSEYIVCSRFHAMIMGMVFDKPIYPICYNCKMSNYLQDIPFSGKAVRLGEIKNAMLQDVIYNYENRTTANAEKHKKYAINQFVGLEKFLHGR